jgi:hypothetical protein
MILWDVKPCSVVNEYQRGNLVPLNVWGFLFYPEDEASRFLQNVGTNLSDFIISYLKIYCYENLKSHIIVELILTLKKLNDSEEGNICLYRCDEVQRECEP